MASEMADSGDKKHVVTMPMVVGMFEHGGVALALDWGSGGRKPILGSQIRKVMDETGRDFDEAVLYLKAKRAKR